MSISEKIKTINKIEKSKSQYNLDRQTAKLSALSSGNASKYDFWLPEKDFVKKSCCIKKICIFTIRWRIKSTDKHKHYKNLDKVFETNKKEETF